MGPGSILGLGFLPIAWRLPAWIALGAAVGLALVAGHLSRAPSYLSNAPETCMNCHVMGAAYQSWQHSSHGRVAVCTDCHVPHDNLVHTYWFKAQDGRRHATVFTLRAEPQVMHLNPEAVPVVQANCQRCHADVVDDVHARTWQPGDPRCWDCHREVPHGIGRSLSANEDAGQLRLPSIFDDPRRLIAPVARPALGPATAAANR